MLESGKVSGKMVENCDETMGISRETVKKSIQNVHTFLAGVDFGFLGWEKSGKIYTKNLCNFIWKWVSFAGFAQTTITTINLNKEYINKGGLWK